MRTHGLKIAAGESDLVTLACTLMRETIIFTTASPTNVTVSSTHVRIYLVSHCLVSLQQQQHILLLP